MNKRFSKFKNGRLAFTSGMALTLLISLSISAAPELAPLKPEPKHNLSSQYIPNLLHEGHYLRPRWDDEFSAKVFDQYLKSLDGSHSVFLRSDIDEFQAYRNQLDDALRVGDLSIPYKIFNQYLLRSNERYDYVLALLQKPMKFDEKERFNYDRENSPWPKTTAEANEVWRQLIKNEALMLKLENKSWDDIRNQLVKRYENARRRSNQTNSEDVFSRYMNALTMSIDPHTNYMSPEQSDDFVISMSLQLIGIGAVLQNDDAYVKIASVIPASPAEKTKQLFPEDRIVSVAQGDAAFTDVVGWRTNDVVKLIRGEAGTTVRLEVLPKSEIAGGKTRIVSIVREKIKLEEQAAKSNVIKIEDHGQTYQIGVIDVPTFYFSINQARSDSADYTSVSRDVKRLLEDLKAKKVDGVVLDLRDNGGGGLAEAVNMVGLFIESGPVVQERDSRGSIELNGDRDPSVTWAGPLAVLVNGQSASASEIVAAALQDYGRALIIGEPTFGKGTVQDIRDLNRYCDSDDGRCGNLKFTMRKFFRINGGSTQNRGVLPDIALPTVYDQTDFGERSMPNAMPWDYVPQTRYKKAGDVQKLAPQLMTMLQQRSAKDDEFQNLVSDVAEMHARQKDKSISLNESERRAERDKDMARALARENARRAKRNLPALKALPDTPDPDDKAPDVRLNEAAHVLVDLQWLQSPQTIVDAGTNKAVTNRPK